eukprot:6188571-Pleurochrysis_carterae.AAC.2
MAMTVAGGSRTDNRAACARSRLQRRCCRTDVREAAAACKGLFRTEAANSGEHALLVVPEALRNFLASALSREIGVPPRAKLALAETAQHQHAPSA